MLLVLLPVLIAISLVYVPTIWVHTAMLMDFYTPWQIFDSTLYERYHNFLVSRRPISEEMPLPELTAEEATLENVIKASNDYAFPVVIRGLLGNSSGVQQWGNHDFWINRYGAEELLCGDVIGETPISDCTVRGFFQAWKEGHPFYISGASKIFDRHPELHEMIDNAEIRKLEPGKRTATQVFIGLPGMGSDIHSAVGVNIFRQIAGQKKWWFMPPSMTPYLWPAINVNGFSAHTKTLIGKKGEPSPWFNRLTRYTTVLNPGDVLINPPWFWHGILNQGSPDSLVIGSPVRFGSQGKSTAFRTNPVLTINSVLHFVRRYGLAALDKDFKPNLQDDIKGNRVTRAKEMELPAHPFDEAD